jgi:immunoglobulin-binding protein 1
VNSYPNPPQHLRQNPNALENDEDALRQLHLTNLHFYVHQAFDALDSMRMEFQILAMAPPAPTGNPNTGSDSDRRQRERGQAQPFEYSERLDGPVSRIAGLQGPLLSKDGKPLRPFTLIDNRERMRQGVFRPDHSLPTMSIDEYLEEEKKRGGIIEGGGPQSEIRPEPDEDNIEKADEETMKARAWDEFTEENPKGSGNTLNRG